MPKVRIEPHPEAFRDLLHGEAGRAAVREWGPKVEGAARSNASRYDLDDGPIPIEGRLSESGRPSYFVGIPHPAGLRIEAKHRVLGSAISSATE